LERLYREFNAREIENVLTALDEDVTWANGMEGGHVHGRKAVRDYWTRQWAVIDPHVDPIKFSRGAQDQVVVEVHQTVRDLSGKLLAERMVGHIFYIVEGLVKRFDIREP
jgi:nuclear transport factor 2 (NTF2) superfamily protein